MRGAKFPKLRHISYVLLILVVFASARIFSRQENVYAAACSTTGTSSITVTRVSSPVFYVDTGITPVIDSGYVAYKIQTGSARSFTDLWVKAGSFSDPTKLTLAPNEDGNYRVGATAGSSTKYTYFYLKGAAIANNTPAPTQNYTLSFFEGNPSSGGVESCTVAVSNTGVAEIIKAAQNKINSVITTTPYLGGQITMTVNGDTGTMGATNSMFYTPASTSGWLADCFVLKGVALTYTGGNTGSLNNELSLNFTNSATTNYTIVYTFDVLCDLQTVTPITPKSDVNSGGANIKHTDTGTATYQAIASISPTQKSVAVSKSVSPSAVSTGTSTPTYTVTLTNTGPNSITLDTIKDTIPSTPAAVSYKTATSVFNGSAYSNPTISGQTLTWTGPFTIPANSTRTMVYQLNLPSTFGTYVNSAVAFINNLQIDTTSVTTDNSPATSKYYVGIPDLSTSTKTVTDLNGGTVKPGETLRYTITVKNTGTFTGSLITVTDTINTNTQSLTNVTTSNCGSTTNNSTSTQLNITNVTVTTLNNCVITFDVSVKTPLNEGTPIPNSATISAAEQGGSGASPSSPTKTVDATPNLIATKTANVSNTTVVHSQVINYTISILNNGDGQGSGISLTDPIDSDVTFNPSSLIYTNCGSPNSSYSAPNLSITNITVNAAATCQIQYQATVSLASLHNSLVTNGVDVSAATEGGNDPAVTNAVDLTINAAPNLSTSTKSVSDVNGGVVEPGDTLRYTIWIINSDTGAGSQIPLTDTIDTDTDNLTNVTFQDCGAPVNNSTSTYLDISGISVSVGTNCRVTFDVTVKSGVTEGTAISNTANIGQAYEGGAAANPSSTTLYVDTTPAISISKTDDDVDNVVDLEQTITYTLTLTNSGNGPGTTTVTDTVTGSVSNIFNVQYSNCGGGYNTTLNGKQITLTGVVVNTTGSCVITYQVAVTSSAPGLSTITNTADASVPSQGGADPSPVSADTLTVHEDPLLAVSKSDDDADNIVSPGQVVTYTVSISNSGNIGTVTSLDDTLTTGFGTPYGYGYTNCGSPNSSYAGRVISITNISVAVGATCTIQYSVQVDSPLNEGTTLSNSADVIRANPTVGNDPDPVSADTLTVDATPNLSTSTKTVSDLNGGGVELGDTLRYTVTLINSGNGRATGVSLVDGLDIDLTNLNVVSITGCGSASDTSTSSTVQVGGINVEIGTNCVIVYDVDVTLTALEGAEINNTADVSASTEGGSGANPSATTLYVNVTPAISIAKTDDDLDNSIDPNQTIKYTVTLSNSAFGLGTTNLTDTISGPVGDIANIVITNCGSSYTDTTTGKNLNVNSLKVSYGTNCVITYEVTVTSGALGGQTVSNTADASTPTEGGSDPSPASADTLTVRNIPVLSVTKSDDDADNVVTPGQVITYTVTIRNLGNATGHTSFTDTISSYVNAPTNFMYSGCGSASEGYSSPTLTVSNIAVTTSDDCIVSYDVEVKSPLDNGTIITNSVDVAAASEGSNNPDPESSDSLTVSSTPVLNTSTKSVEDLNGGSLAPNDVLRYTVTIINTGNGKATGVALLDNIDSDTENLTNITLINCGSSYTNTSTSSILDITNLEILVGTNCIVRFDVSVKGIALDGTEITNAADIGAANEGGSGYSPSSEKLVVDIIPVLGVTVSDNDADNNVLRNQVVTYTITITNTGNAYAPGVSLVSQVTGPTGVVSSVASTNCGTSIIDGSSAQTLSLTGLKIDISAPCVITYTVTVNPDAKYDQKITMSVDVSPSAEGGNDPAPVSADTLTVQAPELIATISLESAKQLNVTEYLVTYLAKLESTGTLPVQNAQISMPLDALVNGGDEVTVVGTELIDAFVGQANLNNNYNGLSNNLLLAGGSNTGAILDARGGNNIGVIRVTISIIVPFGENIPDLSVLGSGSDLNTNSNIVNVVFKDEDKDGFNDATESNTNDRDGDGVVDSEDFDPQGVFYCTDNGKIIPGGKVAVSGPGKINIVADGSNGNYQWFASGKPGLYEMTLTAPTGTEIATDLINTGILDPTGKDNPYSLGSNQYAQTGKLANFTKEANPVYLKFDIASGDPWIINNNIPLRNCAALALTSIQGNTLKLAKTNPKRLIISGAVLLVALAVLEVIWHRRAMEKPIKPGKKFIVAAGNPRRIIARKYGIDNYIERISGQNITDRTTTSSIHYVGWLKKTVKPGDKGLSVIGGHVYGRYKNGAFLKLNEFEKDDIFEVEFGNGSIRKFIVESVRLVKPTEAKRAAMLKVKDIEKQVNLITFADQYDRKSRYTQDKVLVIGRLKEEEKD